MHQLVYFDNGCFDVVNRVPDLMDTMLHRRITGILLKLLPPIVAYVGVTRTLELTSWSSRHETTLLLLLFALVGSLLHVQSRHAVITTLCYGVGFLAARDINFTLGLPPALRSTFLVHLRMVTLGTISLLSMFAAIAESISPGTVWARRCYFAGASLYFFGTGINTYYAAHSWQAIMIIITAICALLGLIFADKIVAIEQEDDDTSDRDDGKRQEELNQAHQQALLRKEWKDPLESPFPVETEPTVPPVSTTPPVPTIPVSERLTKDLH